MISFLLVELLEVMFRYLVSKNNRQKFEFSPGRITHTEMTFLEIIFTYYSP
jgi:hypothetical protein